MVSSSLPTKHYASFLDTVCPLKKNDVNCVWNLLVEKLTVVQYMWYSYLCQALLLAASRARGQYGLLPPRLHHPLKFYIIYLNNRINFNGTMCQLYKCNGTILAQKLLLIRTDPRCMI